MIRGDACASLDLITRLSPEDVDEGLDRVGVFGEELDGSSKEFLWPDSTVARCECSVGCGSYSTVNGVSPSQVQPMMRHKRYGMTEHYVRKAQQMLEGAEGKVTQI